MQDHVESGKTAAFFDLDLTITDIDTFRLFLKTHYVLSPARLHYTCYIFIFGLLRKLRLISLQTFKQAALVGLRGMSREDIHALGLKIFEQHLKESIRKKAAEQIEFHKERGDLIFIVSASPDVYVKAFSDYLGCDGYCCTELQFHDNIFTGNINGSDCIGEEKRRRVIMEVAAQGVEMNNSFAYSDHDADIPLLASVGHPIAVSPTEQLRKVAVNNNWTVRSW